MIELETKALDYLKKLLEKSQESFDGLSTRWNELQPRKKFDVKISEDFHLGFVFGKLEDNFVGWFYSEYGRSMTDSEYKQFWMKCRKLVRSLHKKYDVFYFQE
ncbi:MAG: hypothetical protein HKO48_02445 [Nitrosopumilus sp.]|nr:hypothetical protein [Nitrosopumilus sp.]NNL36711.1 hypothetical protein [Nitrosopumilus sp.]NNM35957.1 hypothetical protein [Nitrosopumilus sp.]